MAKTNRDAGKDKQQRPRRTGLKPVAATLGRVTAPALRKRGLAETRIVTHWPEIVGAELAGSACPEKLSGRGADGGTLHIRVDGALALELQHLAPLVVERINGFFGYKAVARPRLTQGPLLARPTRRRTPPPLSAEERQRLDDLLGPVGDDALRTRLWALGEAILRHEAAERLRRR